MIAWLLRAFGRAQTCSAEVRVWMPSVQGRWDDEPRMTMVCTKPLGHVGRHLGRHGRVEWEAAQV